MKVHVYFNIAEAEAALQQEATVVVIDVVRATTSMVEALANGARAIYPTASTEDAVRLAHSFGREDTLLCGERRGVKVEGFDLGNSPAEYTAEVVSGKRLLMSTTNGTVAFVEAAEASRVLACAFTNLGAVADAIRGDDHVVVLCAGRLNRFSLDDALCAGHLLRRLGAGEPGGPEVNDASLAALMLAMVMEPTAERLGGMEAGRALIEIGLEGDLEVCAQVDRHAVVVEMKDQALMAGG